jgi:hypothetical protein
MQARVGNGAWPAGPSPPPKLIEVRRPGRIRDSAEVDRESGGGVERSWSDIFGRIPGRRMGVSSSQEPAAAEAIVNRLEPLHRVRNRLRILRGKPN